MLQSKIIIDQKINAYLEFSVLNNINQEGLEKSGKIINYLIKTVKDKPDSRILIFPFFIEIIVHDNIHSDLINDFFDYVYGMENSLPLRELLIFKGLKQVLMIEIEKELFGELSLNILFIYCFLYLNNAFYLK